MIHLSLQLLHVVDAVLDGLHLRVRHVHRVRLLFHLLLQLGEGLFLVLREQQTSHVDVQNLFVVVLVHPLPGVFDHGVSLGTHDSLNSLKKHFLGLLHIFGALRLPGGHFSFVSVRGRAPADSLLATQQLVMFLVLVLELFKLLLKDRGLVEHLADLGDRLFLLLLESVLKV